MDGYGKGINGQPVTVQVKWRSNPRHEMTSKELNEFTGLSYRKYDVDPKSKGDLILFTSAAGLHWHTDARVFEGAVRAIVGKAKTPDTSIPRLIDNNFGFWNDTKALIKHSTDCIFFKG